MAPMASEDEKAPEPEPRWLAQARLTQKRDTAVTKAVWAVIFTAGFAVGQWVPRVAWYVAIGLLVLALLWLAFRAVLAVVRESMMVASVERNIKIVEPPEEPGGVVKPAAGPAE